MITMLAFAVAGVAVGWAIVRLASKPPRPTSTGARTHPNVTALTPARPVQPADPPDFRRGGIIPEPDGAAWARSVAEVAAFCGVSIEEVMARSCPTRHDDAEPVELYTGEVVAYLCPSCNQRLDANWGTTLKRRRAERERAKAERAAAERRAAEERKRQEAEHRAEKKREKERRRRHEAERAKLRAVAAARRAACPHDAVIDVTRYGDPVRRGVCQCAAAMIANPDGGWEPMR